jgi:hypothetical protein
MELRLSLHLSFFHASMREAVEYALARLQVKAVMIDEAQHLMQVTAPLRPIDQLNWLNSLTNHTHVMYVNAHNILGTFEK